MAYCAHLGHEAQQHVSRLVLCADTVEEIKVTLRQSEPLAGQVPDRYG